MATTDCMLSVDVSTDDNAFLEVIKQPAQRIHHPHENAGLLFRLPANGLQKQDYIYLGRLGMAEYQVGFMLLSHTDTSEGKSYALPTEVCDQVIEIFAGNWDDTEALSYVHALGYTNILCLYKNYVGGVESRVYIHVNHANEIDDDIVEKKQMKLLTLDYLNE